MEERPTNNMTEALGRWYFMERERRGERKLERKNDRQVEGGKRGEGNHASNLIIIKPSVPILI